MTRVYHTPPLRHSPTGRVGVMKIHTPTPDRMALLLLLDSDDARYRLNSRPTRPSRGESGEHDKAVWPAGTNGYPVDVSVLRSAQRT
jgi:hypothetical protein